MKHNPTVSANAAAATTAIVFVACGLLVRLFPDISFAVAKSWFHGIQMSKPAGWDLSLASFLVGLVSSAVTAWLIGYIFGSAYKFFAKK